MKSKKDYRKGKASVLITNRHHTISIESRYTKKTPDEFWESVYGTLEHIGVFDGIGVENTYDNSKYIDV